MSDFAYPFQSFVQEILIPFKEWLIIFLYDLLRFVPIVGYFITEEMVSVIVNLLYTLAVILLVTGFIVAVFLLAFTFVSSFTLLKKGNREKFYEIDRSVITHFLLVVMLVFAGVFFFLIAVEITKAVYYSLEISIIDLNSYMAVVLLIAVVIAVYLIVSDYREDRRKKKREKEREARKKDRS